MWLIKHAYPTLDTTYNLVQQGRYADAANQTHKTMKRARSLHKVERILRRHIYRSEYAHSLQYHEQPMYTTQPVGEGKPAWRSTEDLKPGEMVMF